MNKSLWTGALFAPGNALTGYPNVGQRWGCCPTYALRTGNISVPKKITISLFLLLLMLAFSPNIVWLMVATDSAKPLAHGVVPGILGLSFLTSLTPKLWKSSAVLVFFAMPAFIESWYIIHFGQPSSAYLLAIVSESDAAETFNYLQGLWLELVMALFVPLAIGILSIVYSWRSNISWHHRNRKFIFISSLFGVLLLNTQAFTPDFDILHLEKGKYDDILNYSPNEGLLDYADSWPTGLPVRFISFWQQGQVLRDMKSKLDNYRFHAQSAATAQMLKNIVLVIGESSRPDHWQLFGYDRQTTPKLAERSNLIPFNDVISPWAWTRMAVPIIITRKPATETLPFFAERSVISAFKEAGFQTAWLSNQSALGAHESSVSLYAQEADSVNFYNPASYKDKGTYDDVLISGLQKLLTKSPESQKFIILHTLGNHFNYRHRYPASFEHFLPSQPEQNELSLHDPNHKQLLINAYDNSVLFTDYVLDQVIQTLERTEEPSVLIYVADHGENIFDGSCNLSGHGHETEHDFRVPMIVWYSKQFEMLQPEKIRNARKHANDPISTTAIFHSLLTLADIHIPDEQPARSVFSDAFQIKPRWVRASGGIYFDQATLETKCKLTPKPAKPISLYTSQ